MHPFKELWEMFVESYHAFMASPTEHKICVITLWIFIEVIFLNFFWDEDIENGHKRVMNDFFGCNYEIKPYDKSTKGWNAFLHDWFGFPKKPYVDPDNPNPNTLPNSNPIDPTINVNNHVIDIFLTDEEEQAVHAYYSQYIYPYQKSPIIDNFLSSEALFDLLQWLFY